MAWVAFDRGSRRSNALVFQDRWTAGVKPATASMRKCATADSIRRRQTFTQYYGSVELDASLLRLPLVGFLPADDPRIVGTVAGIERELMADGLVRRYVTSEHGKVDGLPPGEGVFLPCSFWLADNYVLQGRHAEAQALFERLIAMANDVGLLAEEYDPSARRLLGNFPQAFSHVSLINTALNLSSPRGPAADRQTT